MHVSNEYEQKIKKSKFVEFYNKKKVTFIAFSMADNNWEIKKLRERENSLARLLHNSGQHKFGRFIVNYNMTVVSVCFGWPNKFTSQQASMSEERREREKKKNEENEKR